MSSHLGNSKLRKKGIYNRTRYLGWTKITIKEHKMNQFDQEGDNTKDDSPKILIELHLLVVLIKSNMWAN